MMPQSDLHPFLHCATSNLKGRTQEVLGSGQKTRCEYASDKKSKDSRETGSMRERDSTTQAKR